MSAWIKPTGHLRLEGVYASNRAPDRSAGDGPEALSVTEREEQSCVVTLPPCVAFLR
jgi:hypothetical protein